jgi:hypothetical protein
VASRAETLTGTGLRSNGLFDFESDPCPRAEMQEGRRRPAPDVAQPARAWGAADGGNQIAPGAFASNGIAEWAGSDAVVPTSVGSTVGLSVRVQRSVIALSMTRESGRKRTHRGVTDRRDGRATLTPLLAHLSFWSPRPSR